MIHYSKKLPCLFCMPKSVLKLRNFRVAFVIALAVSLFSGGMHLTKEGTKEFELMAGTVDMNPTLWASATAMLAFLLTFRSGHAYSRFLEGCDASHKISACSFQVVSSLIAFTATSTASSFDVKAFHQQIIRLTSLMDALMIAQLEACWGGAEHINQKAFGFELIDAQGLDVHSIETLADSTYKVETVFQWIKTLVVKEVSTGVLNIPAPILARVFQDLDAEFASFEAARRIVTVPFPFPFAVSAEIVLIAHTLCSPLLVPGWMHNAVSSAVFVFILTFSLWAVHLLSPMIENPFGHDVSSLDMRGMHDQLNDRLRNLAHPNVQRCPEPAESMVSTGERRMSFGQLVSAIEHRVAVPADSSTEIQPSTATASEAGSQETTERKHVTDKFALDLGNVLRTSPSSAGSPVPLYKVPDEFLSEALTEEETRPLGCSDLLVNRPSRLLPV
mmetsp:Transcript_66050/g.175030  ORF Transcript_66050/g.175030 Transcript_66050/m.175030 type:complete len:446 (-) Transcript_66050:168-1505(-)